MLMAKYKRQPKKLVFSWLTVSALFGAVVYPMTLLMPLNKKLYSSSFTLIVIAISGASLTVLYVLIDLLPGAVPAWKRGV